jgi:translation initiation factor IF-3
LYLASGEDLRIWGLQAKVKLFLYPTTISKSTRINSQIRAPLVRLIDENDEQLGEVSIEEALRMARERELDLVEVAPLARPPVCKILDYGKYLYRQRKIEAKHKRLQKKTELKTIRLSLRIDGHDLETKAKQARGFLEEGNSVKVTLMFKGREIAHESLGSQKIAAFYEMIKDVATIEAPAKRQGNSINMVLIPSKN